MTIQNILILIFMIAYIVTLMILLKKIEQLKQKLQEKDRRIGKLEYSLDDMYDKVESLKEQLSYGNIQSSNQGD